MFLYQLTAEIEEFQPHLVTTTYREGEEAARKAEYWTIVLMMVQVIWRDIRKVRVEAKTAYGSDNLS